MRWPWCRVIREDPGDSDSHRALADSEQSLEETRRRWARVNEVAERADQANAKVRSQRDQNHLAEIVRAALLGGRKT